MSDFMNVLVTLSIVKLYLGQPRELIDLWSSRDGKQDITLVLPKTRANKECTDINLCEQRYFLIKL